MDVCTVVCTGTGTEADTETGAGAGAEADEVDEVVVVGGGEVGGAGGAGGFKVLVDISNHSIPFDCFFESLYLAVCWLVRYRGSCIGCVL